MVTTEFLTFLLGIILDFLIRKWQMQQNKWRDENIKLKNIYITWRCLSCPQNFFDVIKNTAQMVTKWLHLHKNYIKFPTIKFLQNYTNSMVTINITGWHLTLISQTSKVLYLCFYSISFDHIIIYYIMV